MTDMTFSAIIAFGMNQSCGAVLSVTAPELRVHEAVLNDIDCNGDREFIDVLCNNVAHLPDSGLIKINAKIDSWPSEDEAPNYTLLGFTSLDLPN